MFSFRPLALEDLTQVHRWCHTPHAARWYGTTKGSLGEIEVEYVPVIRGQVAIAAYVVASDGRDVGLVEHVRVGDHPWLQEAYRIDDPDTANCDVLLGDPAAAHRGLGPAMIREFLRRIVFADPRVPACVIDPQTENMIAIRAYEKVGFRFLRALAEDGEGMSVYLLELRRHELERPAASAAFHVRPAHVHEVEALLGLAGGARTASDAVRAAFEHDREWVALRAGWRAAAEELRLLVACGARGEPLAAMALGHADGRPHLEGVVVRSDARRRGVGAALVERAIRWSVRAGELTATPPDAASAALLRRRGFVALEGAAAGPELLACAAREAMRAGRTAVPAMLYRHPAREV